jgi:branched-chain amino acid aminotransferase
MLNYPAWKNGKYCKVEDLNVSVLDLGLIHCDATYDVIAVKGGEIQNLEAHLQRFVSSSFGWRIPLPWTDEDIAIVLETLVAQAPSDDLLLWIGLTRGVPESGNPRDLRNCKPNLFAYAKPYFNFNAENEATVCLARSRRRAPDVSINQKHKNFAWNDLTMAQWEAIDRGYDTAILCSVDGYITEGVGFNVGFINKDGFVYAPKSNRLEGTVMKQVEKLCDDNDVMFIWADISPIDIYQEVDAMFLTSTAGNVIRVKQFEDIEFEENETLSWLQKNF